MICCGKNSSSPDSLQQSGEPGSHAAPSNPSLLARHRLEILSNGIAWFHPKWTSLALRTPPFSVPTECPEQAAHEPGRECRQIPMTVEFLSSLSRHEMDPAEFGELDSSLALLSQQAELEVLMEELDFHSPEYAKFRMEGGEQRENVEPEEISPCKEYNLDSDSDSIFDISEWVNEEDDAELEAIMEAAEAELQKATQVLQSRARAKRLEDEETKALMQEWSLNDKAFDAPPDRCSSTGIVAPPPLANGLGPVLHMRNGGSLRSMSPSHFRGGELVMQVSNPVVVPSEMGATSMAILRRMAMAGMEGMGAQATMAMPLEDLSGKGVDQLSLEHRDAASNHGFAALGYGESDALTLRETRRSCGSRSKRDGVVPNSDEFYMGIEELAPMAMAKIEALALEGLKIQAEMADQDAPCILEPLASDHSQRVGKKTALMNEEENLMSVAVSLDEWMRLDAGVCGENKTEDQTLAIIAAHNNMRDVIVSKKSKDEDRKKNESRGYMGDTITLAMLVQLRDPLQRHEPVGAPMMALVQAERVMVPPKPKLARRITSLPGKSMNNEKEKEKESEPPRFKIVGVTVAGLKTSQSSPATPKTEVWGNRKQLQAGSRWLAAQGMQKATKAHPALKGKVPQVKVQPGDSLWSISARIHGSGAKWRDLARLNPHIRNPDIIFPNTNIRTK